MGSWATSMRWPGPAPAHTIAVLDHMGIVDPDIISRENPSEEEAAYRRAWTGNIRRLASLPNVVCKVSGLNPAGAWTDDTLRPAVDICLDAFGEDRVMYASNFPACNVATGMAPWIGALGPDHPGNGGRISRENCSRKMRGESINCSGFCQPPAKVCLGKAADCDGFYH